MSYNSTKSTENVFLKISAILFRPQYVEQRRYHIGILSKVTNARSFYPFIKNMSWIIKSWNNEEQLETKWWLLIQSYHVYLLYTLLENIWRHGCVFVCVHLEIIWRCVCVPKYVHICINVHVGGYAYPPRCTHMHICTGTCVRGNYAFSHKPGIVVLIHLKKHKKRIASP